MTVKITDLYLRRAYTRIQRDLDPSTVLFLGDLFDGGREWSTRTTESPEEQYRQYGHQFWQKEFDRFSDIFLHEWKATEANSNNALGERRVIASLPGNHDLGFGSGIQLGVRDRFQAFFGDGNRIDIIGNHTFVSLDTVSLSAKEQPGASEEIWYPADNFLKNVQDQREDLLLEAFGRRKAAPKPIINNHSVEELYYPGIEEKVEAYKKLMAEKQEQYRKEHPEQFQKRDLHTQLEMEVKRDVQADLPLPDVSIAQSINPRAVDVPMPDLPTVLLSHVPLYRKPGEPCGPLRERHPPTPPPNGQKTPVNPDHPNAISVSGGYQYQNVLSEALTKHIISHVSSSTTSDVKYAFSGDDHDYCEVVHDYSPHTVREITVKSISWAMGVRKPGVVLASLWNPLDENGMRTGPKETETMQTHLCLLPDQLGRFIQYALLVGLSLAVLLVRAILAAYMISRSTSPVDYPEKEETISWLPQLHVNMVPSWTDSISKAATSPITRTRSSSSAEHEKRFGVDNFYLSDDRERGRLTSSSSSSTARTSPVRSRGGNAAIPLVLPGLYGKGDAEAHFGDDGYSSRHGRSGHGSQSKLRAMVEEWIWCLWYVARVAFTYYFWLLKY